MYYVCPSEYLQANATLRSNTGIYLHVKVLGGKEADGAVALESSAPPPAPSPLSFLRSDGVRRDYCSCMS